MSGASGRSFADALAWTAAGTELIVRVASDLGADKQQWDAPSALPGWSRAYLLSHVNGNAQALRNLATWARTGVETPMYASAEQRLADIESGAALPPLDLIAEFERLAAALASDWSDLTADQWDASVKTVVGRTVPVTETPWMRAREVCVHAVDLDAGVTFADLPDAFCAALADDIVAKRATGGGPAFAVAATDSDHTWRWGEGVASEVVGPLAQLTAWLAGRPHSGVVNADRTPAPDLTPWL